MMHYDFSWLWETFTFGEKKMLLWLEVPLPPPINLTYTSWKNTGSKEAQGGVVGYLFPGGERGFYEVQISWCSVFVMRQMRSWGHGSPWGWELQMVLEMKSKCLTKIITTLLSVVLHQACNVGLGLLWVWKSLALKRSLTMSPEHRGAGSGGTRSSRAQVEDAKLLIIFCSRDVWH